MKKQLLAVMLLAGGSLFGQISVGIHFGSAPPPVRIERARPSNPGMGYTWVDGYWYPNGRRYAWHAGYWTRPPYEGAVWSGPRYEGQQYYVGTWTSNGHQPIQHDHRWDKEKKNRDYDRDRH